MTDDVRRVDYSIRTGWTDNLDGEFALVRWKDHEARERELAEAKARVSELEEEREECVNQCPAPTIAQAAAMRHGEHFHIITNSQIDAAWELLIRCTGGCKTVMQAAFMNLGIVACEWRSACGHFECRDGETATMMPPDNYEAIPVCPACHGKGYKIKKGAENE